MPLPHAKPGGWWLFTVCQNPNCRRDLLLAEVPSPQQQAHILIEDGRATCVHCQTVNRYRAAQVRRFRQRHSNDRGFAPNAVARAPHTNFTNG